MYRDFTYCCISISRRGVPGGKMMICLSCLWNLQVEVFGKWAECMTSCLRRQVWARDIKLEMISSGRKIEAEKQMIPRSKGRIRREPTPKDWQEEDQRGTMNTENQEMVVSEKPRHRNYYFFQFSVFVLPFLKGKCLTVPLSSQTKKIRKFLLFNLLNCANDDST